MRPGDLVQSNIFAANGAGGYGLVIHKCLHSGYWRIQWADYESGDGMEAIEGGTYDVHEQDIVVVSISN
jgi:hypothetical protein